MSDQPPEKRWTHRDLTKRELKEELFRQVTEIEGNQTTVQNDLSYYADLYNTAEGFGQWGRISNTLRNYGAGKYITENVSRQVIDTLVSIVDTQNHISLDTFGGNWQTMNQAKNLEKFVSATLDHTQYYETQPELVTDSCVFGAGFLKASPLMQWGDIALDRVLPDELVVDETLCIQTRMPPEIFHRKPYEVEELAARYPKAAGIIRASSRSRATWATSRSMPNDSALAIEGWSLPHGPELPGRHVIACDGGVIIDEPWTRRRFPISRLLWNRFVGFYGHGVMRNLDSKQRLLYRLDKFIGKVLNLIAVPRVYIDARSRVFKVKITNEIGVIVPYIGAPPQFHTPVALGAEILNYRQTVARSMFEGEGVNEATARALVPVGVESGAAMREVTHRQSSRLRVQSQRLEHFQVDVAKNVMHAGQELAAAGRVPKANYKTRRAIERVTWSDIDGLLEEDFEMRVGLASLFTMTPAARKQELIEQVSTGMMSIDHARKYWANPDIESENALEDAGLENIHFTMKQLWDGKNPRPESFQSLMEGVRLVQMQLLQLKDMNGVPTRITQAHNDWLVQAQHILDKKTEEEQAMIQRQSSIASSMGQATQRTSAAPGPMPGAVPQ